MNDREPGSVGDAHLEIERERLAIDKARALQEERFWFKNSGTVITALVSLAAVVVSLTQVWTASISKAAELARLDQQKEKEAAMLHQQQEREWSLSVARFVMENRNALFSGNPDERRLYAKVIPAIFPPEVSASLFDNLIAVSDAPAQAEWREARAKVTVPPSVSIEIRNESQRATAGQIAKSLGDGGYVVTEIENVGPEEQGYTQEQTEVRYFRLTKETQKEAQEILQLLQGTFGITKSRVSYVAGQAAGSTQPGQFEIWFRRDVP